MTRASLVQVSGEPIIVEFDGLDGIRRLIGCDMVEAVPWLFGNEPTCYIDGEGKFNGRQELNRAVYHDGKLVDIIFGNMLFCGFDPSSGEDADITDEEIARVVERFCPGGVEGVGSGFREAVRIRREVLDGGLQD